MRALVVGLGIGRLYTDVFDSFGILFDTVDLDETKNPTFTDIDQVDNHYTIAIVCTPNHTHEQIARKVAEYSDIVVVEKPGVCSSDKWVELSLDFPKTRFMMAKNNMWRSNIDELKNLATQSERVQLNWINRDRVPFPGSWFTTKQYAYGGVSRDLIPHLLSIFIAINPDWQNMKYTVDVKRNHQLSDLTSSDYGEVNTSGTYDVDDYCQILFDNDWTLTANWRNKTHDDRAIHFVMPTGLIETVELGLCPEYAYASMINDAIHNLNNNSFWKDQYYIDLKIQRIVSGIDHE